MEMGKVLHQRWFGMAAAHGAGRRCRRRRCGVCAVLAWREARRRRGAGAARVRQRRGGAGVAAAERRTGAGAGRQFREEEENCCVRLTRGARGRVKRKQNERARQP